MAKSRPAPQNHEPQNEWYEMQALIFDVDGTLAETEEAHRRAFNDAFAAAGVPWHWDAPRYLELLAVAGGRERIRHYLQIFQPHVFGQSDLDALIATIHADKTLRYAQRVEAGEVALRPGVERLLDEAGQAGLRLAIATTTSLKNVNALLRATLGPAGRERFEVIGAGEQAAAKKPAPDIYCWVLDRLGLPPEECLAIEDSSNGLRAASGAGIATVITRSLYTQSDNFEGAIAIIDNLEAVSTDMGQLRRWHKEALRAAT